MRSPIPLALCLAACLAGCSNERLAEMVVQPCTARGKLAMKLKPPAEELIDEGKIDGHHRVNTSDQTVLDVWTIRADDAREHRGAAVLLHCLGGSKKCMYRTAEEVASRGFDAALVDLRNHGRSGGVYTTYGLLEGRDVRELVAVLRGREAIRGEVYLVGCNIGAAAALHCAADPEVDIAGVVAFGPPRELRSVARRRLLLRYPFVGGKRFEEVLELAGDQAGVLPARADTLAAARSLRCPVIVGTGWGDLRVPFDHIGDVYRAVGQPKDHTWMDPFTHAFRRHVWFADRLDQLTAMGIAENE